MRLLKKLLGRQESEEQLAPRSETSEVHEVKPLITEEEEMVTRARMEEELAAQRRERGE